MQATLRDAGRDFAGSQLMVFRGRNPDVVLVESVREVLSLLSQPGQAVHLQAVVKLSEVERDLQRRLEQIQRQVVREQKKKAQRKGTPRRRRKRSRPAA